MNKLKLLKSLSIGFLLLSLMSGCSFNVGDDDVEPGITIKDNEEDSSKSNK